MTPQYEEDDLLEAEREASGQLSGSHLWKCAIQASNAFFSCTQ